MIKLSIKQLLAIRELAAVQNFTVAAARLHTTQSNLSTAIQEAENLLGVRLFDRTTKTVSLTDTGREFAQAVRRILDDLETNIENMHAVGRLARGHLAIGATPLLCSTVVPALLAQFNDAHPDISLRLEDSPTADLQSLLIQKEIELAIGTFEDKSPDISVLTLFDDELVVLSHPALGLPDALSWAELSQHRLVSIASDSSVGKLVENTLWATKQGRMRSVVQSNHWLSVISLAEAMRGVCIVPHYALVLQQGRTLRKSSLVEPAIQRRVYAAWLKGRELSRAAQAFLLLLQARFADGKA